jgi:hypothetical protein
MEYILYNIIFGVEKNRTFLFSLVQYFSFFKFDHQPSPGHAGVIIISLATQELNSSLVLMNS